jgi:hypothetical protein
VAAIRADVIRLVRLRYVFVVLTVACGAILAGGRGDWNYFVELGRDMLGDDGLSVYASHGDAQTGPLTLLVAAALSILPRNGFVASVLISAAMCVASVWIIEWSAGPTRNAFNRQLAVGVGGVILAAWWSSLGAYGHLDDATVLMLTLLAVVAHRRERVCRSAVLVGVAIGVKPWAVAFGALSLPSAQAGRRKVTWRAVRGPLLAAGVAAAFWLPFLVADSDTLQGLSPTVNVAYDSVLQLFGMRSWGDSRWLRLGQLVAAAAVVLFSVLRGRVEGAIVAGVATRMLFDPGTWTYYSAGFILGAFAWDIWRTDRAIPVWTIAASVAVIPDTLLPFETLRACLRLSGCLVAIAGVCLGGTWNPRAQQGHPEFETHSSIS